MRLIESPGATVTVAGAGEEVVRGCIDGALVLDVTVGMAR